MSEDPPDRLGCIGQLKAFFASTAAIFAGCLILFGPDEVRADIPEDYVRPIALGAIAYGALFGITAIFASGRSRGAQAIATRFKGLLFASLFALLLWGCYTKLQPKVHAALQQSEGGGGFIEALDRDPGIGAAIGFSVAALVSVIVILFGVWKFLAGPSRHE